MLKQLLGHSSDLGKQRVTEYEQLEERYLLQSETVIELRSRLDRIVVVRDECALSALASEGAHKIAMEYANYFATQNDLPTDYSSIRKIVRDVLNLALEGELPHDQQTKIDPERCPTCGSIGEQVLPVNCTCHYTNAPCHACENAPMACGECLTEWQY